MNWAAYSNLAIATSWMLYLVAMGCYAAEWAFAGRIRRAPGRTRVLATAGAPGEEPARDERAGEAGAVEVPNEKAELRADQCGRSGVALTLLGFGVNLFGVVARGIAAHRAPWGNMYEFITTSMVFIVAAYLVLALRYGQRWLGLFVAMLAAVGNGLAITAFYVGVAPLVPALHSVWFVIHIVVASIAGAAFNIGGLATIVYLLRVKNPPRLRSRLARLPDAATLDRFAFRAHAFGFPLWTFAVAAGAVWAQSAWGRAWNWDPKETWALITWIVYAGYLHARATAGWKGTRAGVIAIIGLATFWFNFVGVNLLFKGLHSYAGI